MQLTAENLAWYQQAARTSAFSSAYRKTVRQKLLEYYLAHPDERETEAAVAELEDSAYAKVDRISTIELLVRYGCYSRAFALTDRLRKDPGVVSLPSGACDDSGKRVYRGRGASLSGILRGKTGHLR
jgi:hypothetical protein